MATLNVSTVAGSTGGAQFDYIMPEVWQKKVRYDKAYYGLLNKFEGPEGSNMPVVAKRDAFKKSGDTVRINVFKELFGSGQTSDSTLEGNEEKMGYGQYTVTVQQYRHGTAYTRLVDFLTTQDNAKQAADALARWAARKEDGLGFATLLFTSGTTDTSALSGNTMYAGGAANRAAVVSGKQYIDINSLNLIRAGMDSKGVEPMAIEKVARKGKPSFEIPIYAAFISDTDLYRLKNDSDYRDLAKQASLRGEQNPLFRGAVLDIDGLLVYVVRGITQGGVRQGCPLRPEVALSAQLTAGATTATVGSDSTKQYTQFFPSGGGTLAVINTSGTVLETMTYTGLTNNTFTGLTRGVTGTDQTHAADTIITLSTARILGMGANALVRAYGEDAVMKSQFRDYGEEIGYGIGFIVGHVAVQDSANNRQNYVVMETFSPKAHTIG